MTTKKAQALIEINRADLKSATSSVLLVAKRHRAANFIPSVGYGSHFTGEHDVRAEEVVDIHITAERIALSALNDDQVAIHYTLAASAPKGTDLSTALVASTFDVLIKNLDGQTVQITDDDTHLIIKGEDRTRHKLKKQALTHDYRETDGMHFVAELTGAEMQSLLRVATCTSEDEARYVLQSIHLEFKGKEAIATAADGFRASQVNLKRKTAFGKAALLLPGGFSDALVKLVKDEDTLSFYANDNRIMAKIITNSGQITLTSPLADGKYPDVAAIIAGAQKRENTAFTIEASELLSAVRRTRILAPETASIRLVEVGGKLHLQTSNQTLGSADNDLGLDIPEGTEVSLNATYLADICRSCRGAVTIAIGTSKTPVLFSNPTGYMGVVMPLLVN